MFLSVGSLKTRLETPSTSSVDVLRSNLLGFVNQSDETLSWGELTFLQLLTNVYLHILPSPSPSAYYVFIHPPSSVLHKSSTSNTVESLLLLLLHVLDLLYQQHWLLFSFFFLQWSSRTSPTSPALAWIWNAQVWTFDSASKLLA